MDVEVHLMCQRVMKTFVPSCNHLHLPLVLVFPFQLVLWGWLIISSVCVTLETHCQKAQLLFLNCCIHLYIPFTRAQPVALKTSNYLPFTFTLPFSWFYEDDWSLVLFVSPWWHTAKRLNSYSSAVVSISTSLSPGPNLLLSKLPFTFCPLPLLTSKLRLLPRQ